MKLVLIPFLLLLALFGFASCRLMCGIEPVTTNWMEIFIKMDCPEILREFQQVRSALLSHRAHLPLNISILRTTSEVLYFARLVLHLQEGLDGGMQQSVLSVH